MLSLPLTILSNGSVRKSQVTSIRDWDRFGARCEQYGIFTNIDTLEVDLYDGNFVGPIVETLREQNLSHVREEWVSQWEADPATLNPENYLKLIETVGKGRFAQRLASRIEGIAPPAYVAGAITYVVDRV